jgi:Uma2 family endonuclease
MTAVLKPELISEQEYIEGELRSEIRHEYIAGHVYAMAGASDDHNRIALNIASELQQQLRGKRCEAFINDMKLKIAKDEIFYYPDVLVACDPKDSARYFRERPTVVFEVLSPDTERIDTREKQLAYAAIPSLKVYVIVAQDRLEATVLRKTSKGSWVSEVVRGLNAALKLPGIGVEIPFRRIYERTSLLSKRRN